MGMVLVCLASHAAQAQDGKPQNFAQVLFTGHSLIDNPMPDWVELIARSKGKTLAWEEQIVLGSPLRVRTRGDNAESSGWDGYSYGKNRHGDGMNVAMELRKPTHVKTGRPYDALVVAENHGSLGSIVWENAIGYLRHIHDRLLDGNPNGKTFYVHTWLQIDTSNPGIWIEHETNSAAAWQCITEKVKLTLEAEDRPARLSTVPAGTALVELVQLALAGDLPGVRGTDEQKLRSIFRDDVHLTDAGIYLVSAVHYATIYNQSPEGAAAPPTVPRALVAPLQKIAWKVAQDLAAKNKTRALDMKECRRVISEKICRTYWTMNREPHEVQPCQLFFAKSYPEFGGNPFVWPDPYWKALPKPSL